MMSGATFSQIVSGLGLIGAAAIVSSTLILLLQPLLQQYALARPNARSSHMMPTPQGGGIAVIAATLGLAAVIVMSSNAFEPDAARRFWQIFAATTVIATVGAVDDIRTIAIAPRLLLQTIVVAAVIAALPSDFQILSFMPTWLERFILLLAGVWFVNLVNFMDGIDWMTVAEVVPLTAGLALIGFVAGALPTMAMLVALTLCGAVLGFAPFNRPVAKLFLGDVGSLPIGLLLLWLLIMLAGSQLAAALILPLYYVADTTLTLSRRALNGEPFWQAHRTHFYQRATDLGLTVFDIVTRVFAVNVGLVALALFTVLVPGLASALAGLAAAAALVGWLLFTLARGKQ
jgi:UDP-N-acetylmuramyl pentapeptide phosphotransferase/UDP-N-acetylglucosamine-1-phosphate transferase